MKKILALVLALAMVMLGVSAAFAAEGAPADTSISVSSLENGDKVNFYQVLKYDETATATGGWVAAAGFTSLTTEEIQKIVGKGDYEAPNGSKKDEAGIDAALAAKISLMAQADGVTPKFANVAASSGTATQATTTVGDAGLYLALVVPGTTDWLYNPVFVAADYTAAGTNSQAAVTTLSYSPTSLAKKEQITLSKEIDGETDAKYDVNVGDTVNFTIKSKVPAYSTAYQDPTYIISDTMEAGLVLQGTPSVTIAGLTGENALVDSDYVITPATDNLGFTVELKSTGLAKVTKTGTAQEIIVTYTAEVTSLENATVSEKENEATVKFSNNPDDKTSYSLLEDKTRTYSFTIDGNLLGYTGTSYETDELIKIGLNADGTPITETKKYHSGTTWSELAPLAGAVFGLYSDKNCTTLYKNDTFQGTVQSDTNGRLKITGLDAGTYYLKETSAPTGYIADNRTFTITITPLYTEIEGGEYTNTAGIKVKYGAYKVLDSYTVVVNDGEKDVTSSYTIENKGPEDHKKVDKATWQALEGGDMAGDSVTPISNTRGTELPSTGGIGTTIFYILGGLLVVGAVVILVARRKAQD